MQTSIHKLNEQQVAAIKDSVLQYLRTESHVTNRILRDMTDINYDQAIFFFNQMIDAEVLVRIGRGGGTRYVRS